MFNNEKEEFDGITVSSGKLNVQRKQLNQQPLAQLKQYGRFFKKSNNSWSERLDEMMEEIEHDLEKMFNDTMLFSDIFESDESISIFESDSESGSVQTDVPENGR